MTRGEAIKELEFATLTDDYMLHEAADMAIRALKQEPFLNKPCVSSGVCEHDKQKVLDKIYAEIEELQRDMLYASKVEFNDIYKILDKYKVEQEDT